MNYSYSELAKLWGKQFPQTDIAEEVPRNEYIDHQERVLRALSWLRAIEQTKNPDMRLINALIAFNSMHAAKARRPKPADESAAGGGEERKSAWLDEHEALELFVEKLVKCDKANILLNFLATEGRDNLEGILSIPYLFSGYWRSFTTHYGLPKPTSKQWMKKHGEKNEEVEKALADEQAEVPMKEVLFRVRVLRNQILHGEAGCGDYYNRPQVKLCAEFMPQLVGRTLKIVMDNPKEWGKVPYPPQGEGPNVPTESPRFLRK